MKDDAKHRGASLAIEDARDALQEILTEATLHDYTENAELFTRIKGWARAGMAALEKAPKGQP